ncbi:MAG: type I methionyl aminopeptidase [Candidatus Peregrinibacteria bacterium]
MNKIPIKTPAQIESMRKGGKILAQTIEKTLELAKPGVSTLELDQFAEEFIRKNSALPGFKGYHGYPKTICANINEEIVHSIPKKDKILKDGDLLTIDCGVIFEGMYTDSARTIGIGTISPEKERLLKTAKIALEKAINLIKPNIPLGDISKVIQQTVENAGYHVVKDLTGHGIGEKLHEDPIILNYFEKPGPILKEGMTLAIEPIFAAGTGEMITQNDKWTLVTADNSTAIQVENTILVTKTGVEILTTT